MPEQPVGFGDVYAAVAEGCLDEFLLALDRPDVYDAVCGALLGVLCEDAPDGPEPGVNWFPRPGSEPPPEPPQRDRPPPAEPTCCEAGSPEKIEVLARRYWSGQGLHHPADNPRHHDPFVYAVRANGRKIREEEEDEGEAA